MDRFCAESAAQCCRSKNNGSERNGKNNNLRHKKEEEIPRVEEQSAGQGNEERIVLGYKWRRIMVLYIIYYFR